MNVQIAEQILEEIKEWNSDMDCRLSFDPSSADSIGLEVQPRFNDAPAIVIRLSALYQDLNNDLNDTIEAVQDTIDAYNENLKTLAVNRLQDYAAAKPHLLLDLRSANQVPNNVPVKDFADLKLIARVELSNANDSITSSVITNDTLAAYGIDSDTLFTDAGISAIENNPSVFMPLTNMMSQLCRDTNKYPEGADELYIATVVSGDDGACAIAYPGFLQTAADTLNGNLYIIPSSKDEMLILRDVPSLDVGYLNTLLKSINQSLAEPYSKLSDHVYYYDRSTRIFSIAK